MTLRCRLTFFRNQINVDADHANDQSLWRPKSPCPSLFRPHQIFGVQKESCCNRYECPDGGRWPRKKEPIDLQNSKNPKNL